MNSNIRKRLATVERVVGIDAKTAHDAIKAERAVLFRTRLEGGGVWFEGGGHVLYPLNWDDTRKAFCAMLEAQDERIRKEVEESLAYCLKHDPFQLDANYPLLEYYLWTVLYISVIDRPFRPLAIPVELCDWLLAIKPEESMHYRPRDWCFECGYRYPALHYPVTHDIEAFLLTRYSKEEIHAMEAPFRGKACMLCGGEIMDCHGLKSEPKESRSESIKWWEDSPAGKLCEAKREEWCGEIEAVEISSFFDYGYLDIEACKAAAVEDFRERRAKQKMIREEHRPSVEEILKITTRR